jgi:hypothetical protein
VDEATYSVSFHWEDWLPTCRAGRDSSARH